MSRWHETGCRRPIVVNLDDTPCCTHCFAFASVEQNADNTLPAMLSLEAMSEQERNDHNDLQHASDSTLPHKKRPVLFCDINIREEFRLLRLSSGNHSAPVHASVEKASVGDPSCASYDVLSYTRFHGMIHEAEWRQIYIGQYWDIVFVPRRYEEAMQSVRHEKTDRHIWMECLCVDDVHVDERTCQTILMPEILRGASRTLMCLASEPMEEYDAAITVLSSFETNTLPTSRQSRSLKALLSHDYFTTIQAVREVVLSKSLSLVYKRRVLLWTDVLSKYVISHASAPLWLQGPVFRYDQTARDTLSLLLELSTYVCRDDRDKIFVLLTIFYIDGMTVDYKVRLEKVFTDMAVYLIRYGLFDETISIAATTERKLPNLPSWVPDWRTLSQFGLEFRSTMAQKGFRDMDSAYKVQARIKPIKFLRSAERVSETFFHVADCRLTVHKANRLRVIGDALTEHHAQFTKIQTSAGVVGTLVITCNVGFYEPDPSDCVFLLPTMSAPVILRHCLVRNSYSLIGTCTMGRGPRTIKEDGVVIPWRDPTVGKGTIKVSLTTQDELDLSQEFYTNLRGVLRMYSGMPQQDTFITAPSSAQVRALPRDFALLSVTGLLELEATLRDSWNQLDQEIGWMFLDQRVLLSLLIEIGQGTHEPSFGDDTLPSAKRYFEDCGLNLPWHYDWNLSTFCRSFVKSANTAPAIDDQHQSPILPLLKSRLSDIRRWTMISAQLLLLFGYSKFALKASWLDFPGSSLTEKWRTIDPRYCGDEWDWSDFKAALRLRAEIWNYPVPPRLRLSVNTNLATQVALHFLGLDLSHQEDIVIE